MALADCCSKVGSKYCTAIDGKSQMVPYKPRMLNTRSTHPVTTPERITLLPTVKLFPDRHFKIDGQLVTRSQRSQHIRWRLYLVIGHSQRICAGTGDRPISL